MVELTEGEIPLSIPEKQTESPPRTYSRRKVLGLGASAVLLGGATLAAGPIIESLDKVFGDNFYKKQSQPQPKDSRLEQIMPILGPNLIPNGSFDAYIPTENRAAGMAVLRPLGWEEAHHNYDHGGLLIGAAPGGKNIVRAGKINDRSGSWTPAVWTPEELIRINQEETYGLFFKYRVEGNLLDIAPCITFQKRDIDRKPVGKDLEADLFSASTGEWQEAGFRIYNLGQETRFLMPEFSFVDNSNSAAPARVSFADIRFGKLSMEHRDTPFPGSQRA